MTSADGTSEPDPENEPADPAEPLRRPGGVVAIAVVLLLQAVILALALAWMIGEELQGAESVQGGGIVLIALVVIGIAWILATLVGIWRMSPWSRGSVLALELLHGAIALGFFQGVFADPALGWLVLGPALVAILLLFTPPVVAATAREAVESE